MLTKIFFTLLVIIIVAIVYRTKNAQMSKQPAAAVEDSGSLSVRAIAYMIIGALVLISTAVFVFKYQADNEIINITVISEDGKRTVYQAKQKSIKGRQFVTLDQRQVTLGESDRIEMGGL